MADDELIIGRDPACDLVLADPTVSGRHAGLSIDPDGYARLRDLNSRNGTFVVTHGGNTPVTEIGLEEGQSIRFGGTTRTSEDLLPPLTAKFGQKAQLRKPAPKPMDNFIGVVIRPPVPPPVPPPRPVPAPVPVPAPAPIPTPVPAKAPPVVLLCGASGSGKTTWLARVIDSMGREGSLTLPDGNGGSFPAVQQRLRMGMPAAPTPTVPSEVTMALAGAGRMVVRDCGGDMFSEAAPQPCGEAAAAVIFFMSCREADMDRHMAAITAMRPRLGRVPSCLAVTHCERYLGPAATAWRGEAGWWSELPRPQWWAEAAAAFSGAMWPMASIGHGPDGNVAETLDEFGTPLILAAVPLGIERPLRHVARALRVAT